MSIHVTTRLHEIIATMRSRIDVNDKAAWPMKNVILPRTEFTELLNESEKLLHCSSTAEAKLEKVREKLSSDCWYKRFDLSDASAFNALREAIQSIVEEN